MLSIVVLLASLSAFASCPNPQELLGANLNAQTQASEYLQPNFRPISQYVDLFGLGMKQWIGQLRTGDLVIDSGAGFEVFAAQIALQTPARSIAINTQNFWKDGSAKAKMGASKKLTSAFKGKSEEEIIQIMSEGSIERFARKQGYSEAILPLLQEQARLITDVWGAYFYSVNRARLIELYYERLAANGRAYIVLGTAEQSGVIRTHHVPIDWVETGPGQGMDFLAMALLRYPNQLKAYVRPWVWNAPREARIQPRFREDFLSAMWRAAAEFPSQHLAIRLEITRTADLDRLDFPVQIAEQTFQYRGESLKYPNFVRYLQKPGSELLSPH